MNLSKKSDVLNLLTSKQELGVDPFCLGFNHAGGKARKQLDLTKVRLCFSVSIYKHGSENLQPLAPVYSKVIYHNMNRAELKIREISDATSSSTGGEKKILICDKLDTSDLQLVFDDEHSGWSGNGVFGHGDVHHRCCLVFRTPPYPGL